MSRQASDLAVGMMDSAYFVGRRELLEFFNELLDLNLSKIEQTASGAVACQLTDYIYPGSIPMHRVNWEAKSDYEYVQNYKLLQAAFTKNRVQRHVDVDKLIRAKYQDNLEFCQWLKAFHDQSGVYRPEYEASVVRAKGKGGKKAGAFFSKNASSYGSKPPPKTGRRNPAAPTTSSTKKSTTTTSKTTTTTRTGRVTQPLRERDPAKDSFSQSKSMEENAELTKKNVELAGKLAEMEQSVLEVEQERDFYFQKLRDVEVMVQVFQENGGEGGTDELLEKVLKVLYATAEDKIVVNEQGEIEGSEIHDTMLEEFSSKIDAELENLADFS